MRQTLMFSLEVAVVQPAID